MENGTNTITLTITCEHCGVVIDEENNECVHSTVDGDVCETCFEDNYGLCEYFDIYVQNDSLTEAWREVRSRFVSMWVSEQAIRADFIYIPSSSEYWHVDDVVQLHDGSYISRREYDYGDHSICDECGDIYHVDDMSFDTWSGEGVCYRCDSSNNEETRLIHPYNYKPEPIFHGENQIDTIGTEVEIDNSDYKSYDDKQEAAKYILDNFGTLIYNKEDGSLSNGFELVSHPATYEYLCSIKDKFKKVFAGLTKMDFKSHDTTTCGLHIHLGRRGFESERKINNFVFLFEKFYNEVLTFSRRTEYKMNRWASRYGIYADSDSTASFSEKLGHASLGKYRIVNLMHSKTIEVRAFRGTLNVDTYFASIQFMLVMKHLANTVDNVVNGVSWQSIVKFAKLQGYTELVSYLNKRGLLDGSAKRSTNTTLVMDTNTRLVVTSNESGITHYITNLSPVSYVSQHSSEFLVVSPRSGRELENLSGRVGTYNQVVGIEDLSVEDENGRFVPLSKFTLIFN